MGGQYNILIDLVGTFLVGTILIVERRHTPHGDSLTVGLLHSLMLCCTLVFLSDIPGLLLDGRTFPGATALLWFFDSAYWVLQAVYCWLWLLFSACWAFGSQTHLKKFGPLYTLPMLVELVLLIVNPMTGWIFTLDAQNIYTRGSLYLPNILLFAICVVAALCVTIVGYCRCTDPNQTHRKLSLAVYMFLPVCGLLLEVFLYGISWLWPMVALSLLMVYLDVQQQAISEEQIAAAALKQEMADNRTAIMLSQIQPHFLYNVLSSITQLCDEDPQQAKRATVEFANFLRGNLGSLTAERLIPFERELEHTKNYLSLEKIRFADRLNIVYDVTAAFFLLPTLTLQPIVENAVHHGVTRKAEGGTVTIRTDERDSAYVVTVEDDGVGFDTDAPLTDGRAHIGIQNVGERLSRMCGGTLEIHSTPGIGTTAVITIPKEAEE